MTKLYELIDYLAAVRAAKADTENNWLVEGYILLGAIPLFVDAMAEITENKGEVEE